MKIVHLADIHIGNLSNSFLINGQQSKIIDIKKALFEVTTHICAIKPGVVLITGDIFDYYNPNTDNQVIFIEFLKSLPQDVATVITTGNHDCSIISTALAPIKAFPWARNIVVLDKECLSFNLTTEPKLTRLIILPYITKFSAGEQNQKQYILETIKAHLDPKQINIVVGHFEVENARLSSEQEFFSQSYTLSWKDMSKINAMFLGHIHVPQQIKTPNFPIYYSGSLIANTFGEEEPKGFYVHDTDDLENGSKFIEIKSRKYVTWEMDLTTFDEEGPSLSEGTVVRIKIKARQDQVNSIYTINIPAIKNYIAKCKARLEGIELNIVDKLQHTRAASLTGNTNPRDALTQYMGLNDFGELKDDILSYGNKLLGKVENDFKETAS